MSQLIYILSSLFSELRMTLSVVVCALIVTTCSAKPSNMHLDIRDDTNYDGNSIEGQ